MSGGKSSLRVLHRLVDRLGRLELVGARAAGRRPSRRPGLPFEPAEGVVVLRAELGAADVLDADLRAGLGLADDDVLELLRR